MRKCYHVTESREILLENCRKTLFQVHTVQALLKVYIFVALFYNVYIFNLAFFKV